jgi:hypothetical protein
MNKTLSYVLPIVALAILAFLAFRWMRSQPNTGSITPNAESAEGIEISDLTGDETRPTGMADQQTTRMSQPENAETPAQGTVRYGTTDDNKTNFTVTADLEEPAAGEFYQLWIEGEKGRKKAMRLVYEKGGFMTEGALSAEFDQVKFIISKEKTDDDQIEEVQLEGTINLNTEQQ